MPRHARQKSETGIYHIMLRGINRQNIFEDEEDIVQKQGGGSFALEYSMYIGTTGNMNALDIC